MSLEIKTAIVINAKPKAVWEVLTNFENYPNWNPFVKSIAGEVKVGNQINIQVQNMKFKPTVLTFKQNKEFRWLGHLFFKGLFDGEHRFKLVDNGDGSTKFEHSEKFGGILVPLFKQKLLSQTKLGFEEMNRQLKHKVENNALE